ncbi:MAG: DUF1552 domain-containing protein [Gemmatimonadetes bacterium]|nr:DUF1552 domain-containing protein [Gemmatimonadota bacterium]MXX70729.1 DUF1552 domain-containing protein [Gemmatimonadota bacterium]MYC91493.1 DUF1552 domain-containing protein [Gemmatimonadota bacterium]MYG34767.1 DUF1552 domain-containing protein [Gemmatimonadota bacterium]MYJ16493.1 DUF1552 domain-containing protein [Gemmatimonadota bacterium]
MQYLTGKHISRRAMLKGASAAIGLPLLDAMIPAGRAWAATEAGRAAGRTRVVCIEQVHGAAGCNDWGRSQNLWSPAETGRDFDLTPSNLRPLEPFRKYLTIVSDTDARMADAYAPAEIGGDHFRTSAVFLTQAHPKQTEGSDVRVGTSFDQLYVQRFGQDTPIPSLQLSIENVDQAGGCAYGYACVYTDTISWASPSDPLPMIRDPRAVFEQLFGAGGTPEQRAERLTTDRSILDWVMGEMSMVRRKLDPIDVQRLDQYANNIRELEQRIQRIEAQNSSGEERAIPEAPVGVPDSFEEHVKLMFDLQVLAFQSDTTRVFSFKLGRDASPRVYPESGVDSPFHASSHHGGREDRVIQFGRINEYHVSMVPYFLEKLQAVTEGDATLLDKTLLMYGSAMADSNLHNHTRCPLFLAGGANGILEGEQHIRAQPGTPMANVMLSLLHKLGADDIKSFGNSTGHFAI